MRIWKTLAPAALLAAALAAAPTLGDEKSQQNPPPPKPATLDDIVAQLQKMNDTLTALRQDVQASKAAVADLQAKFDALKTLVDRHEDFLKNPPRQPPAGPPGPAPSRSLATNTIVLRNLSDVPGTVFVNDQQYDLVPGQVVELPGTPLGPFTREVRAAGWVIFPRETRTLTAGTPYVINITPRPLP
jgi:hypothetical protein